MCIAKGVKKVMYLHNIYGIDVMHNMSFHELQQMLDGLQLSIDIGFIDMKLVQINLRKQKKG